MASNDTSDNESIAFVSFSAPITATSYFNNDLAEGPDYVRPSDGGYLTDDSGTSEGDLPPESYLSVFPVKDGDSASPTPTSSSKLTSLSTPSLASSLETQSSGVHSENLGDRSGVSEPRFTHIEPESPETEAIAHEGVPPPSERVVRNGTNQASGASEAQSPAVPRFPACIVNQINWRNPLIFDEFVKLSKQHRSEVRALLWDAETWFESIYERGSEEYMREMGQWRASRLRHTSCVPMDQRKADEIEHIMHRVSEIRAARARKQGKKENTESK